MRPNSPDGKRTLPTAGTVACRPKRLPRGSFRETGQPSGPTDSRMRRRRVFDPLRSPREYRIGLPGYKAALRNFAGPDRGTALQGPRPPASRQAPDRHSLSA